MLFEFYLQTGCRLSEVSGLNVGYFYHDHTSSEGNREPDIYAIPIEYVKEHHIHDKGWEKVRWNSPKEIEQFKGGQGFELIAKALGVEKPSRPTKEEK